MVQAPGILFLRETIEYTLAVLPEGVYSPYTRVGEYARYLLGFAIPLISRTFINVLEHHL